MMQKESLQALKMSQKELLFQIDLLIENCNIEAYPEILSILIRHSQNRYESKNLSKVLKKSRMKLLDELEKYMDEETQDVFVTNRKKRRQINNSYHTEYSPDKEEFDF